MISAGETLNFWRDDAKFADIGSPTALLEANISWARERGGSSVILAPCSGAFISESLVMGGATIAPGARIVRSIIAPGAQIGAYAHIEDCLIADDVIVPAKAHLLGQTLVQKAAQHTSTPPLRPLSEPGQTYGSCR